MGGWRFMPEILTEPVWFRILFIFFLFVYFGIGSPSAHIGPRGIKKILPPIRQMLYNFIQWEFGK